MKYGKILEMNIEDIKKFLINSRKLDRTANSYIIYGGKKEERIEIATFFAQLLICEDMGCGKCDDCKKIEKRVHPDVKWIIPERSLLSINEVRWVKEDIFVKAYSGKWKVYIFQINYIKDEAANSLLKILEEPPEYVSILILSDSINFFLPTITSRCQKLKLNYCLPEYNEEFKNYWEIFSDLISVFKEKKYYEFFKYIDNFVKEKEREDIELFIEAISFFLRDAYFKEMDFPSNLLVGRNISGKIIDDVNIGKIEKTVEIKNRIRYNVNTKLAIENLVFTICSFI